MTGLVGRPRRRRPAARGPHGHASTAAGSRSSALPTASTRSTRTARTRGGPLADGIVADRCVTCPLHGRRFDLRTGAALGGDRGGRRPRGRSSATASCGCGCRCELRARREQVRTTCPYCGVGCGLVAERRRTAGWRRCAGDPLHPVNRGATCRKPLRLPEAVARARPRDDAAAARESPDERWRPRHLAAAIGDARQAAAGDRRRARPGRDRVLHLRPAADRGLLRGQQAGQGLPRHQQRRLELAPVHVERGRRLHAARSAPTARRRRYADIDQADCILLLGSNTAACHPIVWSRIRRRQAEGAYADRRRPAPDADRRARRPAPAGAARHRPAAAERDAARARARRLLDERFLDAPHRGRGARRWRSPREWTPDARRRGVRRARRRTIVDAARRVRRAPSARWRCGRWARTSRRVGTLKNRALHQPLPGDRATSAGRAPGRCR